jgi:hypothetical protein
MARVAQRGKCLHNFVSQDALYLRAMRSRRHLFFQSRPIYPPCPYAAYPNILVCCVHPIFHVCAQSCYLTKGFPIPHGLPSLPNPKASARKHRPTSNSLFLRPFPLPSRCPPRGCPPRTARDRNICCMSAPIKILALSAPQRRRRPSTHRRAVPATRRNPSTKA